MIPILSQMNPAQFSHLIFYHIFNIIPSIAQVLKYFFAADFPTTTFYAFFVFLSIHNLILILPNAAGI